MDQKQFFTIFMLCCGLLHSSLTLSRKPRTGSGTGTEAAGSEDGGYDQSSLENLSEKAAVLAGGEVDKIVGSTSKGGGTKRSSHGNVTLKYLVGLLADAKLELTDAQQKIQNLEQKVKILEHNSSMTVLLKSIVFDYLRTSQARLYADKNFSGPHEDYNMAEDRVGVGCQNLNYSGPVAGHVQSVELVDTCVQLYSAQDCVGRRVLLTGGAGRSNLSNHRDLTKFINFPIYSIGPCIAQPGGKSKYPNELFEANLESRRMIDGQGQVIENLDDRIDELQDELERLELRALGTSYSSDSAVERWNSCGGFITLHAGVELSYKNPGAKSKTLTQDDDEEVITAVEEETCIWVIWAKKGGSMTFSLKELKPGIMDESLGMLTIQRDFSSKSSTTVSTLKMEDLQKDLRVYYSSALVIFTSSQGQSFKLRVADAGQPSYSYMSSPMTPMVTANFLGQENSMGVGMGGKNNSLFVPMKTISNNLTGIEFTHPPFAGEKYSSFERRHIVLKGVPGKKIHLALEFLDTEDNGDFLSIYKFVRMDNKFEFVQKYSGSMGPMENVTFEGDLGDPLFLYFHSDISVEYNGFQIFFTYFTPTDQNPPLQRISLERPFFDCGGLVMLPDYNEIVYQNNQSDADSTGEQICIFVLSAQYGGPIELKLMESNFGGKTKNFAESNFPHAPNATLSIQTGVETQASNKGRIITSADQGQLIVEDEMILLLVFRSSEKGQSFCLKMKDMRQRRWRANLDHMPNVTFLSRVKDEDIFHYSYPPPPAISNGEGMTEVVNGNYSENELVFIILKPEAGKNILLSLDFVDTDPIDDWVQVYKFSTDENNFEFNGRFSGRIGYLEDSNATTIYQTRSNQAMLLYFRSDRYSNGLGFKISYAYNKNFGAGLVDNFEKSVRRDKSKKMLPQRKTFDQCGGFITLDESKDLEVTFKFDGDAKRIDHHDCLFMVTTTNDGIIGLTLLDDPDPATTNGVTNGGKGGGIVSILHSDFLTTENSSRMASRLVQNGDLNQEIVSGKSNLILIFDWPAPSSLKGQPRRRRANDPPSQRGQSVRLRLRELGILRRSSTLLRLLGGSSGTPFDSTYRINGSTHFLPPNSPAQNLSYPLPPLRRYENGQKECVLLFPAAGENLSLAINYLDIKNGNDYLSIFRWSTVERKMIFLQRLTGQIGDIYMAPFVGHKNEPFLVYFQSDNYGSGRGYRMSFFSTKLDPLTLTSSGSEKPTTQDGSIGDIRHPVACGALVSVGTESLNLFYKNPTPPLTTLMRAEAVEAGKMDVETVEKEWTCVWVLWPTNGGFLRVNLTSFNFTCSYLTCPVLTIQFPAHSVNSSSEKGHPQFDYRTINTTDLNKEIELNETSALLIFRSRGGQSFNVRLRDLGENIKNSNTTLLAPTEVATIQNANGHFPNGHVSSELLPMVGASFLDDFDLNNNSTGFMGRQIMTFSYPQTTLYTWMAEYLTHERRYVIIKPVTRQKISLMISYVDTERDRDSLSVFKFSVKDGGVFVFLQKYTGSYGTMYFQGGKFEGDEGMPMLLYFCSDHSIQKSGFRITYSYNPVTMTTTANEGNSNGGSILIDEDDYKGTMDSALEFQQGGFKNLTAAETHNYSQPISMTTTTRVDTEQSGDKVGQLTGSTELLENLRLSVATLKKDMKEKYELMSGGSSSDWRLSCMIVLTLLSTLTSLGLLTFFLWQRHEKRKQCEVKNTITYARTGTREAVLLGGQDEDTML